MSEEKRFSGFFGFAHKNTEVASNPNLRSSYLAYLKHSLLFHERLIFSDHMIVNSPNFRFLYDQDPLFQRLVTDEFMEIAYYEKYKNGPHFSLEELRGFYRNGHALHKNMDLAFCGEEKDYQLREIEKRVSRQYTESEKRDPDFTKLCDNFAKSPIAYDTLGFAYSSFYRAYEEMRKEVPVLGIVHFDPEQTWGTKLLYDYWERKPGSSSKNELIAKFSCKLTPIYRAMLLRTETDLLDSRLQSIIPRELYEQRALMLASDYQIKYYLEQLETETHEINLDLNILSRDVLAHLPVELLQRLRKSDEARNYFKCMNLMCFEDGIDLSVLKDVVYQYTHRINQGVIDEFSTIPPQIDSDIILKIARTPIKIANDYLSKDQYGILHQLAGLITTTIGLDHNGPVHDYSKFIPFSLFCLPYITKPINQMLEQREASLSPMTVNANITAVSKNVEVHTRSITQFTYSQNKNTRTTPLF